MELDEDDSHLCIRCNQTIIGLQNYVNHRQRNCSASTNAKPTTKPFSASFDFLDPHGEKKMGNYADFNFGDEQDDDDEDEMDDDEVAIVEQNNKSTESEYKPEYDYDFFSSLELQYMSKRELPDVHQSGGGKNFSHRMLTRKATAAIMAQNGDEWIDEATSVGGKKDDFKYFDQHESESDDDSDESEPEVPRNYTRGKWKPGSRPPNNFTGGKWKPGVEHAPPKLPNWDVDNESSNDANLDKSLADDSHPPPSHTKGKWMPGTKITKLDFKAGDDTNIWCGFCSRSLATRAIFDRHLKSNLHLKRTKQQNDLEAAADSLPVPSLNELSSHFKAVDDDDADELDRAAATSTPLSMVTESAARKFPRKKFRSRSKVTCEECDMRLPVHLLGNHLISHFHYRKMLQNPKKSFDIVLNNFHKIVIQSPFQCQPCKFYFNTHDEFMRHWNSIGHVEHVEMERGDGTFLCSLCKFECGANADMTEHLNGGEHQQVVTLINRSKPIVIRRLTPLRCGKCSTAFRYNIQLMRHLKHCEGVAAGLDSHFICDACPKAFQSALSLQKHQTKIHKISIFFCTRCQLTFKTALESKLHRRTAQHKSLAVRKRIQHSPQIKARVRKTCPVCKEDQLDVVELRSHILATHPEHRFSCGRCGMKFPLAQEVSRHVRDKVCKFYRTAQSCTVTSTQTSQTSPEALIEKVPTGLDLNVSDILSPSMFRIATTGDNEFAMMIGDVASVADEQVVEISFTCKVCDFSTDSHAEFLFHEALHRQPADQDSKQKIECQICKRFFGRQSLRQHLRQHTNERLFQCPVAGCPMSFTRKANLKTHIANRHRDGAAEAPSNLCPICGRSFQSKHILEQHKFIHRDRLATRSFPCQQPNCFFVGRSSTDTSNHQLTHSDEKLFACSQPGCDYRGQTMEQLRSHSLKHQALEFKFTCEHCDYKTKLSGHLKRHMRVHEMEQGKIYKCPHCDYACNNSENLRKHVLKTNKHPGKFLYECVYCEGDSSRFKSNQMKEYQSHLQLAHSAMKKN